MLRTAALLLAGCLGMLGGARAADGTGTFMYGISKSIPNEGNWWIVEVNPLSEREEAVKDTGILGEDGANALAFDTARNQLIFYGEPDDPQFPQPTDGMYVFDVTTQTLTKFATLADMQFPSNLPNGAAYYSDGKTYDWDVDSVVRPLPDPVWLITPV